MGIERRLISMQVSDFARVSLIFFFSALGVFGSGTYSAAQVTLNPGDNIQAQVIANPAGTEFLFNPGTYDMQGVVPKTGNVFDGQGWATLDGKNTTKTAFRGTASNVTIQNLTIQNYNSDLQKAAVDAEFGNAWTIRNNIIASNFSVGVNFGNNSQVIGNQLINNGQAGFAGGGGGWLVENNLISNNNTRDLDWGFEAGGGKVTEATSGTFRGNTSYGNGGPGIWLDIDANNILIENNLCAKNTGPGIMVEISENATVRYNTLINNGEVFRWDNASLLISSSENNKVYGNIVDVPANRLGIFLMSQGREHTAINNEVYDNEVSIRGTRAGSHGVDRDDDAPVFTTNDFHDNSYYVTSLSTRHFSWADDYTLAQAQSRGLELGSTMAILTNVLGDYDRNGIVDAVDYTVWRDSLGSTDLNRFSGADGNGNGEVDMADYYVWKGNFGQSVGGGAPLAGNKVPESGSLWLILLAAMTAGLHRGMVIRRCQGIFCIPRGAGSGLAADQLSLWKCA